MTGSGRSRCFRPHVAIALATVLWARCGEGAPPAKSARSCRPPEPADAGPAPAYSYRRCLPDRKVGEFLVELAERHTAVSGSIAESPVPVNVRQLVGQSGGCRLLRRRQLVCDPPCTGGSTCGESGQCQPYPENLHAGSVAIRGLRCQVQMQPDAISRQYWDTALPHPGYSSGAAIELVATGAEVPAFSLVGQGVAAFSLQGAPLRLDRGKPLPVSWQVADPGPARVQLDLNVDQHGVTPVTLSCEADDTGSFEIPLDLIEQLLAAGVSGYPKLRASRQTVDSVDLPPGCVELIVASVQERSLEVAGHTACRSDADCLPPRRCNVASQSCL